MKTATRNPALNRALVTALILAGATSALAGTVGGSVTAINSISENYISAITIGSSTPATANGQIDTPVVTGLIDNNDEAGWKLTIVSTNVGKLFRGLGGPGREILYTNIKFVKTGGTLGAGLTDPHNTSKNIVTGASGGGNPGTTIFNTGVSLAAPGTATSATVAYAYSLRISWDSDLTILSGTYSDTLTLTLANDT